MSGAGRRSFKTSIARVQIDVEVIGERPLVVQQTVARESSYLSSYLRQEKAVKLTKSRVPFSAEYKMKFSSLS